ncbi:MAG: type I pullulanase, partial [Erysipelotrichaceae bacterium]|nr:type I pullulanase [Erysipelotrichaceae bacterium]
MFANQSMRAYLDDFHKIVVEVKKTFYLGHVDSFYIHSKDEIERLFIDRVEETHDTVYYTIEFKGNVDFSKRYTLVENHGLQAPLEVRFIVKTKKFEELYSYDGDDLGAIYYPKHTDFALWAPTANAVDLELHLNGEVMLYRMKRTERGVHRYSIRWDLANAKYVYLVHVNNQVLRTADPYAMSSIGNNLLSAVIDSRKLPIMISTEKCAKMNHYTDAIIYEGHVRDFTSLYSAGTRTHGKFESLMETGTTCNLKSTGMDYIKELGITHIQLLPVADFATVDEFYPMYHYNWGYDPLQYGVPEGSFSSNPNDPYARVIEFRKLVNAFHANGIMVIMDVVFNHMYDIKASMMENCCPYYFFRYDENKELSNGSFCGNDFDSTMYMARKHILDMLKRWMVFYGVDGFRFDLMGILDIDTMNQVSELVKSIKPYGMVYGEGWNMPTALDNDMKAMIYNHGKMKDIAFFNDRFRDYLKGRTGDYDKMDQGFLTGDLSMTAAMTSVMTGSCLARYGSYFDDPNKSINYVECHDNATLWDKMAECCANES